MKINLLSLNNEDRCITITGNISDEDKQWFLEITDHAWLKKTDVVFDQQKKMLIVKMKRHAEGTKAKIKFFKCVIWDNCIAPTKECILTIRDIEKCIIENEDPDTQKINDVKIRGVLIKDGEIYIGSACRHENDYGIVLNISRINISLEDK